MDSKWWNSKELKSQTPSTDSNLGPRCEASGKTIVLLRLEPRVEARNETRNLPCEWQEFCDFEPCLKTNFGISVNALPNFSTKMGGRKLVFGQMAYLCPLVNAQLKMHGGFQM
ncbi:hypothetical protein AVEN_107949-1 [Araneus ventricosus]|uniref:Uncharacterized protein n=1 Tax=Araneus ventricosus TaxID=182803 RepID=A0A4Y2JL20_ARAVE|nr:hypothetical protein AVEN_107949-1 [Araneus ventricosus]